MKKLDKLSEQILFDVDKRERQELFNRFDEFMKSDKSIVFRKYLALAEYCLEKDNRITKQNGKIFYPKQKVKK